MEYRDVFEMDVVELNYDSDTTEEYGNNIFMLVADNLSE